jgi:hypothetical protein
LARGSGVGDAFELTLLLPLLLLTANAAEDENRGTCAEFDLASKPVEGPEPGCRLGVPPEELPIIGTPFIARAVGEPGAAACTGGGSVRGKEVPSGLGGGGERVPNGADGICGLPAL